MNRIDATTTDALGPLAGRCALVTGAGTGIGLAIAQAMAAAGASVVLHAHDHREVAETAGAELRAQGLSAQAVFGDLSSAADRIRLIEETVSYLGGLDILVNNAGVSLSRPFAEVDLQTFQWLMDLNVGASFFCTQHALQHLSRSGRGSVINVTSVHGVATVPGLSAYAATKGALISLTRSLALELAPLGIRVNAIGPGLIEVPRYQDIPSYTRETWGPLVPIGRVGVPEDIAGGAVYLASDAASFVTGQVLYIDGGMTARLALFLPDPAPSEPDGETNA